MNRGPMRQTRSRRPALLLSLALSAAFAAGAARAHGDVTPQAVDTRELPTLGEQWRAENPYRKNDTAIKVGTSAYNQNCARCHGLEAISGGNTNFEKGGNITLKDEKKRVACVKDVDGYFLTAVRKGRTRNGAVYMPPFEGTLNQEAVWSIKTYLETRREKPL